VRYLTFEKRLKLKELLDCSISISFIAQELGVCRQTIYNELRRGKDETGNYNPFFSEKQFRLRQQNKGHSAMLKGHPELAAHVADLILQNHYSPKQIVKILESESLKEAVVPSSVNTLYSAIDNGLIPGVTRESLRSNKTKMFSGGMVCIPKRIREKFSFCDGDVFDIEILDDKTIVLKKQSE